jgi:hypothetical protein
MFTFYFLGALGPGVQTRGPRNFLEEEFRMLKHKKITTNKGTPSNFNCIA